MKHYRLIERGGVLALLSLAACSAQLLGTSEEQAASKSQAICSNPLPPTLADISRGWPSGVIRYKFVGTQGGEDQRNAIRAGMANWESQTGVVDFVEDPNSPSAFVITTDSGCNSGQIAPGCQIEHELGHLIGLAHEQQRLDSGRYVALNLADDICDDGSEGTKYIDTVWSGTNYGAYNENSVMHYGPVLGNDGTYDFTRLDGTVNNLGSVGTIQPSDVSSVLEMYARFLGWDRFRSRGVSVGPGPLAMPLAAGVTMQASKEIAAARVRRIDLALVYGSDGRVYESSRGSQASSFKPLFSQANAIAATTAAGEFAVARATNAGIAMQLSNNAQTLAASNAQGNDSFNNALTWSSAVSWGVPPGTSAVSEVAMASLGPSQLSVISRLSNGELWIRHTTKLSSVTGAWTRIATRVAGRPAIAAFVGGLRVYYSQTSGGVTTLRESRCSTSSCAGATTVATVQAGTTAAAAASQSELHLVIKDVQGRLSWRRMDVSASFKAIGGILNAEPSATNSFEDRFGEFALFGGERDGNLWQRVHSRYFNGRLSNFAPNDLDRDGRTDPIIVRDGTWWVLPSTGLPGASFPFGKMNDVLLPAADYDGNGVSDVRLFHRATGTWSGLNVDRSQARTGAPLSIASNGAQSDLQFGVPNDRPVPGDYDGDWVADEAVFRPSNGTWYASLSGGGPDLVQVLGSATDRVVPGDYDGDGKTDPAVFSPATGTWSVRPSAGGADITQTFGSATDRLVPGDYDGDGRTDFAYFRPTTGTWNIRFRTGEPDLVVQFGEPTDRVTPGDYDGDGRTDIALFRPRDGKWYVHPSTGAADIVKTWGNATDALPWPDYTKTPSATLDDYDGDAQADLVVFRPSSGTWFSHPSGGGSDMVRQFGVATDRLVPGDYDGDGRSDVAVFRVDASQNATWYAHPSAGGADLVVPLGVASDVTVRADFDGDGKVDPTVFRPSSGTWLSRLSAGGANLSIQFGVVTDVPSAGDYDGDGRTDVAVFRPSNGTWYSHLSAGGPDLVIQFGVSSDRPVQGDYDGDGKTDVAVFRPSNQTWFVHLSAGGSDLVTVFGGASDRLVPHDFDGDHRIDSAYYQVDSIQNGTWHSRLSGGGADLVTTFGVQTDVIPYQQ